MGADFIFTYAPLSDDKETLKEFVRHMPIETLQWIEADAGDEYFIEGLYEEVEDDEDISDESAEVYNRYRTALIETIDHVHSGGERDIGMFYDPMVSPHPVVITGGMSWGDDPTDSFIHVARYRAIMEKGSEKAAMTAREAVDSLNLGG